MTRKKKPANNLAPKTRLELLSGQRQSGESDNAVIASNDYLRMGAGRSLRKLLIKYSDLQKSTAPTQSINTLMQWSSAFSWVERAATCDATWETRKTAEREAVMAYGLALDYERVEKLKRLADFLEAQIYEQGESGAHHNIWLPDVKQIGNGDNAERVDIERFNAALLDQYRATLDDIAKEVGGRVKKQELTGADGGAIPIVITKMPIDEL